jgi:metal-responsive CopG/Arc/MetJ family transcriptional regulator
VEKVEKKKKVKITFTLDDKLKETFEDFIDKNLLSRSKVIEKLIEDYMKDKNSNIDE